MHHVEQMNIILVVEDEKSLYTNFSPEAEFDHDVKEYIKSKIAGEEDNNKSVQLTVVSQDPLDEEKFRLARVEKSLFDREQARQDRAQCAAYAVY